MASSAGLRTGSRKSSLTDITINGNVSNVNNGSNPLGMNINPNNINNDISDNNINLEHKQDYNTKPIINNNNNSTQDMMHLLATALQQLALNQSNSNGTGTNTIKSNNHIQLRAAIDDKTQLIEFPKFNNKIIKPEAFIKWKRLILDAVDGSPKFSPILLDTSKSWSEFQLSNAKYPIEYLEKYYLETHKSLWSLISSCFDNDVITSITTEIMNEVISNKNSLPRILGFTSSIDYTFYKDCKSLLDKLSSRYEIKSGWNICNLLKQFSCLEYKSNTDPILYIENFNSLYRKLQTLCPHYKIPDDMLAYQMLGQLPSECQAVKVQFLDTKQDTISISKVQETLISWWQSQQTNNIKSRDYKGQHNKTSKSQEGKPTRFKKQIEGEQKQDVANPATTSSPNKQTNKKKFQKNNNNFTKSKSNDDDHELALIDCTEESTTNNNNAAVSSTHRVQPTNKQIALDSGATSHIVGRKDILDDLHPIAPCRVAGLTGTCKVDSAGKLKLAKGITINSVKYVPNSPFNLMSVSQIVNKGYQVIFTQEGGFVIKPQTIPDRFYTNPNNLVLKTRQEGNLFVYDLTEKRVPVNAKYGDFTVNTGDIHPDNSSKQVASITSITTAVASITPEASCSDNNTPITDVIAIAKPESNKVDIGIQTNLNVELNKDVDNLHSKLAHLGSKTLQLTNEHYELGISKKAIENHSSTNCTTCISCKAQRAPIGKKTANPSRKAENIMDCWHVDLIGPLSEVNKDGKRIHLPSLQGKIYILVIV
ncbi:MAG: hypothetical protein ACXW2E_07130, partial [Nitrososphaeraceae archaeon]